MLYLGGHPDVYNKKVEAMNHRKVVTKNTVVIPNILLWKKKMKSGTVEHGFKTNRKTFTTPMKKYAGCLTTAHRKLNRQNTYKDCIRQLQNMAML
jgi:hypothetical protein